MSSRLWIVCIGIGALSTMVSADRFEWTWNRGDPGHYGLNDRAGKFRSIRASFDDHTNELSWRVTFDDDKTDGLTLVLSDGDNPKGHAGELAILYIDASDDDDLRMTAYAYNGRNSRYSFRDGDGTRRGNQTPDVIHTALDTSWIRSFSVTEDDDDRRTFDFTIDASTINSHVPMYPDDDDPWFGIGWGERLGLWLHTYKKLDTEYDDDGLLTKWKRRREGWFDGSGFETMVPVPMPGAAAMGLGGLALVASRRRR